MFRFLCRKMEPETGNCTVQSTVAFLMVTLIMTVLATAILCASILTQNWEYITWDREKLKAFGKEITGNTSGTKNHRLEWLLDEQVARLILDFGGIHASEPQDVRNDGHLLPAIFFVPVHSGIWTFCFNLTDDQQKYLDNFGFPKFLCTNYLRSEAARGGPKTDRQHRMQNLSISCALVCLIILGCSALTGVFGITKHQISAVLVTGVMYLLAAIFATFSLMIINFKRAQGKTDCFNRSLTNELAAEGIAISNVDLKESYSLRRISKYFDARIITGGWSLHLGWAGAGMCVLVSILWIILSKIMRYNPLNTLLTVI